MKDIDLELYQWYAVGAPLFKSQMHMSVLCILSSAGGTSAVPDNKTNQQIICILFCSCSNLVIRTFASIKGTILPSQCLSH